MMPVNAAIFRQFRVIEKDLRYILRAMSVKWPHDFRNITAYFNTNTRTSNIYLTIGLTFANLAILIIAV